MEVYIAADHGGFELKDKIKQMLLSIDLTPIDCGAEVLNTEDDYPTFAQRLVKRMQSDNFEGSKGILICRSGIGMSIVANKFKGIYAALCSTREQAVKAREHNNANILCLDADYVDEQLHLDIIKTFLQTEFAGWDTRHGRRVQQILSIEQQNMQQA
jgi:RpiB/LacA/LacB family sugar-phosphate isomerase